MLTVVGFDPSLRNWGIVKAMLNTATGKLSDLELDIVQTSSRKVKGTKSNRLDLEDATAVARTAIEYSLNADLVIAELPHGSQSARGAVSAYVCMGVLAAIQSQDIPIIFVDASNVKKHFTGNKEATKDEMIEKAVALYGDSMFPKHGKRINKSVAEHMADAIAVVHAGLATPEYKRFIHVPTHN